MNYMQLLRKIKKKLKDYNKLLRQRTILKDN